MAFKRKSTKRSLKYKPKNKRYSRKKKAPYRSKAQLPPKKQPFSSHVEKTNMKYRYNNDIPSGGAVSVSGLESAYLLNDINRPRLNQTTLDYLPMGHDQYTSVFNKFKVNSAAIELVINPNTTTKQCTLLIQLNSSSRYTNTVQGVSAASTSGLQNTWTYALPIDKEFKWKKYVSFQSLESLMPLQYKADFTHYIGTPTPSVTNAGNVAYRPQKIPSFKFSLINETDNTIVQIPFEVNINYYTTWYDRKRLPQSISSV